jgi:hypothetical protein
MDLNALREAAIEATARALYDKLGVVPSDESDAWEEEYRKQFAALRQRYGTDLKAAAAAPRPANGRAAERTWPELRGSPEEQRWGASIRDERLRAIPSEAVRLFMVQTWPRAKQWIDTRDVPTRTLLQRLKPQYDDWRKKRAEAAAARKAAAEKNPAAAEGCRGHGRRAGRTDRCQRAVRRRGDDRRKARRNRCRGPTFAGLRDE